ncbi:hypothetical protein TNCT_470031 [Trichonephila clavata]|uniref:Uncharacterized protein n=1 Tax=Trichonephila clavata TaxID=2740835 RepID=A0A8X6M072_TRICU|nr:hypothetical protein TNCT_470031 [Trichonephila clavata]
MEDPPPADPLAHCRILSEYEKNARILELRTRIFKGLICEEEINLSTDPTIGQGYLAQMKSIEDSKRYIVATGSASKPATPNLESTKKIKEQYSFKLPNKKARADLRPTTPPPIVTANSLSSLSTHKNPSVQTGAETPKGKIDPIMLKFTENYNLILQDLQRSHPMAEKSYVGEYKKIITETDEHDREITQIFTDKKLDYFVIQPINNRLLNLIIKGLPVTAKCDEIKNDLTEKDIKLKRLLS